MSIHEIQDVPGGKKIVKYTDGFTYTGEGKINEFGEFVRHGQGRFSLVHKIEKNDFEEIYDGEWKDDQQSGQGTYSYISGAIYRGLWSNGQHHGSGIYLFSDGSYYEGDWVNHKMHGKGVYVDGKGVRWQGEFRNGSYQSVKQNALRREAHDNAILEKNIENCNSFLQTAIKVFTVEKKTMKENSKPLFSWDVVEEVADLIESPGIKFDEKKPDIWLYN
jgi:hypothetical protein